MAAPTTVWGLDIGQRALKALKLENIEGELQVAAFDIIEHPKILTAEQPDRIQLIRNSLMQFLARNDVTGIPVAVAVPGASSFTRFVKLPPVEKKKVPDIVRFEAEQQIPFPIESVVWRWQTFHDPDSPDVEVGIFAMKRDAVAEALSHFVETDLKVDIVQMAPLSLYNFMRFDGQIAPEGATLLADVGTDKTDLVVADGARIWTRTIQIGGNDFTEALVKAFKLSFAKAERLKRTAATSKYARQIFQAMRPVFADLVQEIQRSVGYYTSLHRETRFKRLIGLGNGFRLPGLQKFLEQNLGIPVVRIDSYNRLRPSPTVNAPTFTENVLSFAVAYGLALQGLELTEVNTNLLPGEIAQRRVWAKKRPWFAAAAALLLVALAMFPIRASSDRSALSGMGKIEQAEEIITNQKEEQARYNQLKGKDAQPLSQLKGDLGLFAYRRFWPEAWRLIVTSMGSVFRDHARVAEYTRYLSVPLEVRTELGTDAGRLAERVDVLDEAKQAALTAQLGAADRQELLAILRAVYDFMDKPRDERRIAFIEKMEVKYVTDIAEAERELYALAYGTPARSTGKTPTEDETAAPGKRGFRVILDVRTPLPKEAANDIFARLKRVTEQQADRLPLLTIGRPPSKRLAFFAREKVLAARGSRPAAAPRYGGEERPAAVPPEMQDPIFPRESMADDRVFTVGWAFTIEEPAPMTAAPAPTGP
jgi:type IV pilus assembly protein PilM